MLGGATISVVRLVPLLERRGWRFIFWAARPSRLHDELRSRGLEVYGAPRHIAYSLRALRRPPGAAASLRSIPPYLRRLVALIRESRPSIVHANSVFSLAEAATGRAMGVPTLLHVHEMISPSTKGKLQRRAAHLVSDELVGVSTACARALELPGKAPRIVNECAPLATDRARGSADGRFIVGTVGVISQRKGSDLFVEAARIVRERRPEIEFELIGGLTDELDVDWGRGVLARAAEVGIRYREHADVPAALAGWDAFVLPSRRDPFPIAMLEAMGSGLAVVGTAVDGLPEQITPGTGILTPADDPRSIAEAVIRLRDDRELRAGLGEAARHRVGEHFTLERQAGEINRAYESAIARAESGLPRRRRR